MSRPTGGLMHKASQPVSPLQVTLTQRRGIKNEPRDLEGVYVVIRSHLCPVVKIMAVISILPDKWHLQFLLG